MFKRMRTLAPVLAGIALIATGCLSAQAQGLYAITGAGNGLSILYRLDPTTGAVIQTIGSTGFNHVTALAFNPTTNALFGYASGTGLLNINPLTGAGTLVSANNDDVPDMSFNSSGQLFGWSENGDVLKSIDTATGVSTQVGTHNVNTFQTGLAFNSAGTLYLKPGSDLYTVDPITGLETFVETLSDNLYNSLAFDANDNLFSVQRPSGSGGSSFLEGVNIGTGAVTQIGDIGVSGISALAFQPSGTPTNTPEPGSVALLVTGGLSGAAFLRRKRTRKTA